MLCFLQDKKLVAALRESKDGILKEFIKVKLDQTRYRATANKTETPMVVSNTIFGLTANSSGTYYLTSYKFFPLSRISGANWTVNVGNSFEGNNTQTKLTVLFIKSMDNYKNWLSNCNTTCTPPTNLAAADVPVCIGLDCSGSVKGLNSTETYGLFVSYPLVYSLNNPDPFGNGPTENPFSTQVVHVSPNYILEQLFQANFYIKSTITALYASYAQCSNKFPWQCRRLPHPSF